MTHPQTSSVQIASDPPGSLDFPSPAATSLPRCHHLDFAPGILPVIGKHIALLSGEFRLMQLSESFYTCQSRRTSWGDVFSPSGMFSLLSLLCSTWSNTEDHFMNPVSDRYNHHIPRIGPINSPLPPPHSRGPITSNTAPGAPSAIR